VAAVAAASEKTRRARPVGRRIVCHAGNLILLAPPLVIEENELADALALLGAF
jgi:hypothetical protein